MAAIRSSRCTFHRAPVCLRRLPMDVLHALSTIPLPIDRPSASRRRYGV